MTCRLITAKEGRDDYWSILLNVREHRQSLTREDLDPELVSDDVVVRLVDRLLQRAFAIRVFDISRNRQGVSMRLEFDNIRARSFRGRIYPQPEHFEVRTIVRENGGRKICFLFGQSFAAHVARGRINKMLAERGAFRDVQVTPDSLRRILDHDSREIIETTLTEIRAAYRARFDGANVDQGMDDYIRRARQAGGRDDSVTYVSRVLRIPVRIALRNATISASIPETDDVNPEEELIGYVMNHILPYV